MNNISFRLAAGEHLAVFGPGGSGKTLLAKALKGSVFHTGNVVYSRNGQVEKPRIAFVPATHTLKNLSNRTDFYYQQRFNSFDADDAITLREELLKKGAEEEIIGWLNKFQLLHRIDSPLIQLSNGELKKTQLISYLLGRPEVLILDEAFNGLDAESRKVLHRVINELGGSGVTIILITDTHELPSCITHFAELGLGKLVNFGPVSRLGYLGYHINTRFGETSPSVSQAFHIGPVIQMMGVNISYGKKQVLKNIHWQVMPGECWLVKGPNGVGKSTLLSLINADHPQGYSQPLSLFGRKRGTGESIWDIKKKIGFVSPEQHNFFDKTITVFQTIASGFFDTMGLYKKLNPFQTDKVNEWIHYFSLTAKAGLPLSSLSFSEQRLVFIARAMVKSPLILAMDEPCQGLDDYQRRKIIALVDELYKKAGMTLLFISHYDEDVPSCVKYVLELENGQARTRTFKSKKIRILQEL